MSEFTPIRHLKPGQKDLLITCIVLDIGRPNHTKENHEVRTVKVADKSGSVNLSLWDEPGKLISCGDILRLSRCYTNVWKNCLTLYIGRGGELLKVGEFCLLFAEVPFMSEANPELSAIQARIRADRGGGPNNNNNNGQPNNTNAPNTPGNITAQPGGGGLQNTSGGGNGNNGAAVKMMYGNNRNNGNHNAAGGVNGGSDPRSRSAGNGFSRSPANRRQPIPGRSGGGVGGPHPNMRPTTTHKDKSRPS